MNFRIRHQSIYNYSKEVILSPQHLYFYPSARNYLTLKKFEIEVTPASFGLAQRMDAENNLYHQAWYNDQVKSLTIDVEIQISTIELNPFNFIIESQPKTDHIEALEIYKKLVSLNKELTDWVDHIYDQSGGEILTFTTFLNKEIKSRWDHQVNYVAGLMSPNECFTVDNASCRDLSWMMIQMLRFKNIPARFVSGYAHNPELTEGHELHAWVEAWFDGAGWVGLDPSAGVLATHNHIPVCTSYHPANTFPVQGTFFGDAKSKLTTTVKIDII